MGRRGGAGAVVWGRVGAQPVAGSGKPSGDYGVGHSFFSFRRQTSKEKVKALRMHTLTGTIQSVQKTSTAPHILLRMLPTLYVQLFITLLIKLTLMNE